MSAKIKRKARIEIQNFSLSRREEKEGGGGEREHAKRRVSWNEVDSEWNIRQVNGH